LPLKKDRNLLKTWILLLILIAGPSGLAQQIKESPIGQLAVSLISALNSNNKEEQLRFINAHMDSEALRNGPDVLIKNFGDLFDRTGGVEITDLRPGRDPGEVKVILKSKRGNLEIELLTHLSRESPDKLIGFISHPLPDPDRKDSLPWPRTSLNERDGIAEIEHHVQQAAKDDRFSGAVLVAKNDRVLLSKAYGFANKEKQILNQTDTRFNLGSMNKMFTSVAIAQLVQAGKLSFGDTLDRVLPDYPNESVAKKITVRQLLTHTAGLGDFFKPEFQKHREKYVSLASYLPLFAQEPLLFEPGKSWSYSNAGFIVLGLIVERLSGENYFDYVRSHIFKPSGMMSTDSYERDAIIPNLALGYIDGDKNQRRVNEETLPVKGSSAGGGYSTTNDLFRFSRALLNNRLLNAELTKTIMTGKVADNHPNSQYAFGFKDVTLSGRHMVGHGGGGPGINGYLNMLIDNGYTVIVLGNYSPPSADGLAMEISNFLISQ